MSSGLGPTRLMSPRSTFHNWGNSSRLVARSHRPTRVRRTASGNRSPLASRCSDMVRNLSSQNGFANLPGRCCRNRIGRPMDNQTSTLTAYEYR